MKKSSSTCTSPDRFGLSSDDSRRDFFFSTLLTMPCLAQVFSNHYFQIGGRYLQQSKRYITLNSSLQLEFNVQVETQLQAHWLRLRQPWQNGTGLDASGSSELLVVSAATAATGVNTRGCIRSRVVKLAAQVSQRIFPRLWRTGTETAWSRGLEWEGGCTDLGHGRSGSHVVRVRWR